MPVIEASLVTSVMETSVTSTFSCWAVSKVPCAEQQVMAVKKSLLEVPNG